MIVLNKIKAKMNKFKLKEKYPSFPSIYCFPFVLVLKAKKDQ